MKTIDFLPYHAACTFDEDWAPMLRHRGEALVKASLADVCLEIYAELPGDDWGLEDIREAVLALFRKDANADEQDVTC